MKKLALIAALGLITGPALAHTGLEGHVHGFTAGFSHPFFGADHLLAMFAVGLYGAAAMADRLWLAPATFVGGMIAGALLQTCGITLPQVEGFIAVSVLGLGLLTAFALRIPTALALGLTAFFALFHGYTHAAEASGAMTSYALGFVLGTSAIHASGVGLGRLFQSLRFALPAAGAVIAAAGLALLAG